MRIEFAGKPAGSRERRESEVCGVHRPEYHTFRRAEQAPGDRLLGLVPDTVWSTGARAGRCHPARHLAARGRYDHALAQCGTSPAQHSYQWVHRCARRCGHGPGHWQFGRCGRARPACDPARGRCLSDPESGPRTTQTLAGSRTCLAYSERPLDGSHPVGAFDCGIWSDAQAARPLRAIIGHTPLPGRSRLGREACLTRYSSHRLISLYWSGQCR